jgi:hypothetical protein
VRALPSSAAGFSLARISRLESRRSPCTKCEEEPDIGEYRIQTPLGVRILQIVAQCSMPPRQQRVELLIQIVQALRGSDLAITLARQEVAARAGS